MGEIHCFEKTVFLPCPVEEAFAFHTCMNNIRRLLPEHVQIYMISAPCNVGLGDRIQLAVYLHWLRFYWESVIVEYEPYTCFVDTLEHGPFEYWRHQHLFEAGKGGTFMKDRIEFKLGFGILGGLVSHFFVQGELEKIFTVRHEKAVESFKHQAD